MDQVRNLYGEPTKQIPPHSNPFPIWYYEKYNLYVTFYRKSETAPIGGIVQITIQNPSTLKTDTDIGVGDSINAILSKYKKISATKPNAENNQNVFVNGQSYFEISDNKIYYPTLSFVLKNDQITEITLSNEEQEPK
jgi:hypothetical protein